MVLPGVPEKLIKLRKERGLSQVEAARAAGISPQRLSALERGTRGINDADKKRIAAVYQTTVGSLFFGEDSTNCRNWLRIVEKGGWPVGRVDRRNDRNEDR